MSTPFWMSMMMVFLLFLSYFPGFGDFYQNLSFCPQNTCFPLFCAQLSIHVYARASLNSTFEDKNIYVAII